MSIVQETASLKGGATITVTIESLTHGGAGKASVDGMPIFVQGGLPGQILEVTILKHKGTYAEARINRVLRKSIDELPARCPHVGSCGGCTWQQLRYQKQLAYKEDIVRETLEHLTPVAADIRKELGGRVLKIIPSPQVFNYRNKLEMSFGFTSMNASESGGKRIYFDEGPTIGFHEASQWSTILPIHECHLYDEALPALLLDVRRFLEDRSMIVYNPKTRRGLLRGLLLRRGVHTEQSMLCFLVNARKKELEPLFHSFLRFAGRPGLASLLVIENTGLNDKPDAPVVHTLAGSPTISERLFDLSFDISPFSFFQTNTLGAEKLYQAISQMADLSQRDTVLDAYCGMGTIGQYLSRFCQKVVGIESHPSAIDDALSSSSKNRIRNISFYAGRTEQVLRDKLVAGGKYHFDCIVLDPPRAGLHPQALQAVVAHTPEKIIYVSCNTATFARDLGKFLDAGYELRAVQPVDMFPHTPHIETVALLHRKA